jgi:hypothetical protein
VSVLKVDNLWDRVKRGFIRSTNGIMDVVEMIIVGIGYALPVAILIGAGCFVWLKLKRKNKE